MSTEKKSWIDDLPEKEQAAIYKDREESSWIQEIPQDLQGIEVFRYVVKNGVARFVDEKEDVNLAIDLTTASMVCQVHDKLNEANQAKFGAMWPLQMIDIAFEILGKAQAENA